MVQGRALASREDQVGGVQMSSPLVVSVLPCVLLDESLLMFFAAYRHESRARLGRKRCEHKVLRVPKGYAVEKMAYTGG